MSARSRWTAGAVGLALAAGASTLALIPAGSANAAQQPTPSYTAGHDQATFGITGVEDSNCVISTGGTSVYIKPGDEIDFDTAIASASVGGINLLGGNVTGLNVKAVIDAKTAKKSFTVSAGKTVKIKKLSSGNHSLHWTATSVSVAVPKTLLTPAKTIKVPLSNASLQSGAKLSWTGVIHVTTSAPQCKITVATPKTKVSVGPVKVTVPPVHVTVPGVKLPTNVPSVPNLLPTKGNSAPATGGKKATTGKTKTYKYTPPAETIPDEVVPHGQGAAVYSGGGGYTVGSSNGSGNGSGLTDGTSTPTATSTTASGPAGSVKTSAAQATQDSTGKHKTIDLASSTDSHSGQLPVLLAILAVIALAMVAGTYARLYLLGRKK